MLNRLRALITGEDMTSSGVAAVIADLPAPDHVAPPGDVDPDAWLDAQIGKSEGDADAGAATHKAHPELGGGS
jgi:hypothetical protein